HKGARTEHHIIAPLHRAAGQQQLRVQFTHLAFDGDDEPRANWFSAQLHEFLPSDSGACRCKKTARAARMDSAVPRSFELSAEGIIDCLASRQSELHCG